MAKRKKATRRGVKGKVKVALIGAGGMANSVHYPSLKEIKEAEMVGLCDLVPEKLKTTAAAFGIKKTFSDYREMIEKTKPDAVYALMPPHHLFDVAMDVLERDCHLFIEKPPALTAFQTECLAKRAEDKGLITGVGFQRRYHPLFQRCFKEVKRCGTPHLVVSSFFKNAEPSEVHPYYRGAIDILTSDGIHALDAARFYAGGEVVRVSADVSNLDSWYATRFTAMINFDNGCVAVFMGNWRCGARRLRLELHSLGCSAYADVDGMGEICRNNESAPAVSLSHTDAARSEKNHRHQGFFDQTKAFIQAVRRGKPLHNSLTDAAKTMRLVERVYKEAETAGC